MEGRGDEFLGGVLGGVLVENDLTDEGRGGVGGWIVSFMSDATPAGDGRGGMRGARFKGCLSWGPASPPTDLRGRAGMLPEEGLAGSAGFAGLDGKGGCATLSWR